MGRRSRARADAAGLPRPARPAKTPAGRGPKALGPVRRLLTTYLIAATLVALVTLTGIVVLGGTLGPFITLAVVVVAAGLVQRWARGRLAGLQLVDEDRVIQTLAGGMLVICVVLAAASALLAAVT